MHQAALDAQSNADKLAVEREKIASAERIALAGIVSKEQLAREQMAQDREIAQAKMIHEGSLAEAAMQSRAQQQATQQ
jgi:hypothetical protein